MRRWWPFALLLLALMGLQLKFWWGDGGLREARALESRVEAQRRENARLQQRNDALSAEVEDLKSGEAAVEERARAELGWSPRYTSLDDIIETAYRWHRNPRY